MNADAATLAIAARQLLNAGDPVGAERVLAPVLGQLRTDAPSLHLMGLIKKAQNNLQEAERYLRSAIAHSLSEGGYYNDLGVVLQSRGEFGDAVRIFRAAIALLPLAGGIRVNLVRALMAMSNMAEAEAEARAYIKVIPGPEGWSLLGQVQRAQDKLEDALTSAESALKFDPKRRGLRFNYATALEAVNQRPQALEVYEGLARQDLDTSELALNYARALFAEGRRNDAEVVAEQGVKHWGGSHQLQAVLARMRWLRGEGENCTEFFEAEIKRKPADLGLRLACADALHRGGHMDKALRVLSDAHRVAPDNAALLTALGVVLDELDRPQEGLKLLRRVVDLTRGAAHAQRNMLSTLLRSELPEEALRVARALRAADPEEQYLIACESTALRMLGDPAYKSLCDYDRYVRTYDIPAPRGYFSSLDFNAALAEMLRIYHRSSANPLDQVLNNGGMTAKTLLSAPENIIKNFIASIDSAVRDYIKRLPEDANDPMGRRRGKHYRYAALWSVQLGEGGFQPNHVHDRGWISSAYYAAILPADNRRDPKAGWLKFGEPNRPPPHCGPERWIEPKVGMLVLFPSYMWHGTAPFEGGERLSAAFDVSPG